MIVTAGRGAVRKGAKPFLRVHTLDTNVLRELDTRGLADITSVAFSPGGEKLALAGAVITRQTPGGIEAAALVRVIDPNDGHIIYEVKGPSSSASWVRFVNATHIIYRIGGRVVTHDLATTRESALDGWVAAVSADGSVVAVYPGQGSRTSSDTDTAAARMYALADGRHLESVPWADARHETATNHVLAYAFRPDGKQIAIGFADGKIALWDRVRRAYTAIWPARPFGPRWVVMADQVGLRTVLPTPTGLAVWDLEKGRRIGLALNGAADVFAMSPNGVLVAAGGSDAATTVWDTATGRKRWSVSRELNRTQALAFHPNKDILARAAYSRVIYLKATTGEEVQTRVDGLVGHSIVALVFSADGKWLAIGDELGEVRVYPVDKGKPLFTLPAPDINATVSNIAFDAGTVTVVYGNGYNRAVVYDAASGARLRELGNHPAAIYSLAVDATRDLMVTGGGDDMARMWDWRSGAELAHIPHGGDVVAVALTPDGQRLFTFADFGMRVWDLSEPANPREIVQLAELPDDKWFAADSLGRFESNSLDSANGMHWLLPDDPLHALPPEIFMRDYFEPRLVARLLTCRAARTSATDPCDAAFTKRTPIAQLNRVQPRVEIIEVRRGHVDSEAVVRVRVTPGDDPTQPNKKTWSDAFDLRLFRDGQLVRRWPSNRDGADDIMSWRSRTHIELSRGMPWFEHEFTVPLPSSPARGAVIFSAYAFNADRVKSRTAVNDTFHLPATVEGPSPKAYVISIGVNGYQTASRNLSFAVNDATAISRTLARIRGYDVVNVTLTSEASSSTWRATKGNIREVFSRLAGTAIGANILKGVAEAERLAKARPDDLVVISFSGHGYTRPDGAFYLLASDSGGVEGALSSSDLGSFISSEELSEWLGPIDAGQMAMIIDACHSGASVPSAFKPGPMGDHGLGQLAYDKAMLILAASQREDVAIESSRLRHGLLTYALIHDGLAPVSRTEPSRKADHDGNRVLALGEWLSYGEERAPALYLDLLRRPAQFRYVGKDPNPDPEFYKSSLQRAQTPALFDFSRGKLKAVLWP
jgi:WD40 repeat protein